jgi:GNAT superfamily N-acetyltransferase
MENKKELSGEDTGFEVSENQNNFVIRYGNNSFNIERLDWDSKLLNFSLYRMSNLKLDSEERFNVIKNFLDFLKLRFEGIDCLMYKVESSEMELIQDLQKNGFILTGLPVRLSNNLKNVKTYEGNNIRFFRDSDINLLSEIARNTFLNAHRYNDLNFDKKRVDDLHSEWIKNSCKGRSDVVLVYEEEGIPHGFIACNMVNNIGLIDLIAVSKDMRGKGIGKKLVLSSLSWFKERASEVNVNTEAMNYPSLNMYLGTGFKIEWVGLNLNYWFK